MQDNCILDSNVIAAIFFLEKNSERAEKLVENKNLITLDLAFIEIANVAWKKINLFNQNKSAILKAHKKSMEFINTTCEVINSYELIDASLKIAIEEKLTVYDSLFIAAAQREKIPLYTFDKTMKINDLINILS